MEGAVKRIDPFDALGRLVLLGLIGVVLWVWLGIGKSVWALITR
jgi:hypothetical protein